MTPSHPLPTTAQGPIFVLPHLHLGEAEPLPACQNLGVEVPHWQLALGYRDLGIWQPFP